MYADLVLIWDVGTTAVKTTLANSKLEILHSHSEEYSLLTQTGTIEVAPETYLDAVRRGARHVLTDASLAARVRAIAFTTQGETMVAVDADGAALGNAVVWLDSRAGAEAAELASRIDESDFYRTTGLPTLSGSLPLAKAMHLKRTMASDFELVDKILFLEDYLILWLTGRAVSEKSLQTSSGWFDLHTDSYWHEALDAAGISIELLPELMGSGEVVGPLLPARALELGVSSETVVVTGAMDQVAVAIGAGCIRPGTISETTGTAMVVAASTTRPIFDLAGRTTIYRHAIDGSFLYLLVAPTVGMTLKWLRGSVLTGATTDGSYSELIKLAASIPAGSDGMVTLPHLEGAIDPEAIPNATGVFFGMTLGTTNGHFVRSVLESSAFLLREFLEKLVGLGVEIDSINSTGGGSQSELWQQIKADVCAVPLLRTVSSEAASAGAALLALWGCGLVTNGVDPRPALAHRTDPNPVNSALYERPYVRYQEVFSAVKPLWTTTATDPRAYNTVTGTNSPRSTE